MRDTKAELLGEPAGVSCDCLVEYLCLNAIQLGEIAVEHGLLNGIEGKLGPDPERALELYVEAELSCYDAIDAGLTNYSKCLQQAVEGQAWAREAVREKHRRIRAGEE